MFVSYNIKNNGYGYMCFAKGTSIFNIYKFLDDIMLDKTHIIFARSYSNEPITLVDTYREGKYYTEKYKSLMRDVEDVGDLYTYLYNKYGFTNILGYR